VAKQNVTHSCGHTCEVNLFGPGKERDRKIAWLETVPCYECKRAAQQAANMVANIESAQHNAEIGLPALTGSEMQIPWAETIRAKMVDDLYKLQAQAAANRKPGEMYDAAVEMLARFSARLIATTEAKYWIDNRDNSVRELFNQSPETAQWRAEAAANKAARAEVEVKAQAERAAEAQRRAAQIAAEKASAENLAAGFTPVSAQLVGRDQIVCRDAAGREGAGWIIDGDWVVTEAAGVHIGSASPQADRIGAECRNLCMEVAR